MTGKPFSFGIFVKYGNLPLQSSDTSITLANKQQSEIMYLIDNNNRFVTSFSQLSPEYSYVIENIKAAAYRDETKKICPKGANTYYLKRTRKPDLFLTMVKHNFSLVINPSITGRFAGIYSEFEIENESANEPIIITIVITEDEYNNGNFGKKLGRIITSKDNADYRNQYAAALYYYFIQGEINLKNRCVFTPSCSGWSVVNDNFCFASANIVNPFIYEYLDKDTKNDEDKCYSSDIINRRLLYTQRVFEDVANEYKDKIPKHWKYKLLVVLRTASLLLYFFNQKNIVPDQMFVIEPSGKKDASDVIALLQTINYSEFSPISLPFSEAKFADISNRFFSNDGIALLRDTTTIEKNEKLNASISLLSNNMMYSELGKTKKRQFIVIISDNPANISYKHSITYLSFAEMNCKLDSQDIQELQKLSGEFDFALIQKILDNHTEMEEKIYSIIDNTLSDIEENSEKINTVHILNSTMTFLKEYGIVDDDEISEINNWLSIGEDILDNRNRVVNEFYGILNHLIHTDQIKLADQNGHPFFVSNQNMAFESKGYLNFGEDVFKKLIVNKMKTTNQLTSVLNALHEENMMPEKRNAKKFESKRTLKIVTEQGNKENVSVYSVSTELLDVQSEEKLYMTKFMDFFYPFKSIDIFHFAPIINSFHGTYTAGIQIASNSNENFHMYVTGQSGKGKTYFLMQQALFRAQTDDKVIIFDNGGYFTQERLKVFFNDKTDEIIEKYVAFHYIPKDKIPVDLFSLEGCEEESNDPIYFQASRLFKVITSTCENLGSKQVKAFTEKLKETAVLISGETFSDDDSYSKELCDNIINIITTKEMKELSIDDHLVNTVNFVRNLKMIRQTWKDFLNSHDKGKVIIITTGWERTELGANLIDMMLASLNAYKVHNLNFRLSVIIDEISFMNTSDSSTINALAREGRQRKISLILASQDFLKERLNAFIGNFSTKIFFQPTDCNLVAKYIKDNHIKPSDFDSNMLAKLQIGECVIEGNLYSEFQRSNKHSVLLGKTADFIGSSFFPLKDTDSLEDTENEQKVTDNENLKIAQANVARQERHKREMQKKPSFAFKKEINVQKENILQNSHVHVKTHKQPEAPKSILKFTVLVEDTTSCDARYEHGLSIYIEYGGKNKILLDAGQTELFAENAQNMRIDLSKIDFAVLSHGHYDHSGGFTKFFEKNLTAIVYARKEITEKYFSANGCMHEISVPNDVQNCSERFTFIDKNMEIAENIYLVSHNTPNLSQIGEKCNLYRYESDYSKTVDLPSPYFPDDFKHEQSLVFDTPKGLVIFNSCSHGGVENIIREAKEFCDNKAVYAYIGGFHMKSVGEYSIEKCTFNDVEIKDICDFIKKENIAHVYTGHCTGKIGFEKLKKQLGDIVKPLTTGMVFEL